MRLALALILALPPPTVPVSAPRDPTLWRVTAERSLATVPSTRAEGEHAVALLSEPSRVALQEPTRTVLHEPTSVALQDPTSTVLPEPTRVALPEPKSTVLHEPTSVALPEPTAPGAALPDEPLPAPAAETVRVVDATKEPRQPADVALSELRVSRAQWLGREVRFTLQIESQVERWNPWLTRFAPSVYRGWQAWSDEALLWQRAAFEDPAPRLFARRGTPAERRLASAARYERFRVRACVREIFLDEPWIEILEVELLPHRVGEGTILHAERALALLAEGRPQLAASELDRAASAGLLPGHVARALAELRARCAVPETP